MSGSYMLRVIPAVSSHSTYSWTDKFSSVNAFLDRPVTRVKYSLDVSTTNQVLIEKVRERLTNGKVEISLSAYDTAWVAMVPSGGCSGSKQPCFPKCLDWIIENQNPDGSWSLIPGHPYLIKDSLSCTLACVLALHKWDVGHQLVQRGLDFIASNGWATSHVDQISPIGFNIVFPAMINYAKEMDLTLPFSSTFVDSLLRIRDSEISERNQNLGYVAEGLGNSCNWKEIVKTHQRSNGSLFNSPATTAAVLINGSHDDKCFDYLTSVLKTFNNTWVPTIYPMDIYTRLCTVDTLRKLGISQYFRSELGCILDGIYRSWQEKEDELFSNVTSRAMAFRLLRTRGYEVSSDELAEFADKKHFLMNVSLQYKGVNTVLELYRAAQFIIHEKDDTLEKINAWTSAFLKHQLLNQTIHDKRLRKQVEYDLKNFNGILDRVENRRNVELYDAQDFQTLKTAYRSPTIHNEDFLLLSAQDFTFSQDRHRREIHQLQRWWTESRLDQLTQGRNAVRNYCNIAAAIYNDPELSEARISVARLSILYTALDDFFDDYGPREEALCLIKLVRNWKLQATYCSREVEILFTALYDTINENAAKAFAEQGRCVKNELSQCLDFVISSAKSMDSRSDKGVSTLDDYFNSYALENGGFQTTVLMPMWFLGIKVPEGMTRCEEFTRMLYHGAIVCRLLNDFGSFEREDTERPANSVSLLVAERGISEEEAILKLRQITESHKRKLLQMIYQRKGSVIPREIKDIFWKTCQVCYSVYPFTGNDEFTTPTEISMDLNATIWDPLQLPAS